MNLYKRLFRPLAFSIDSERVHDLALNFARVAGACPLPWNLASSPVLSNKLLETNFAGLQLKNPIGLAAGFDKNCQAVKLLASFGFSHLELGTVTAAAQPGNPRPRIFRLPKDRALINRMGFPSCGVEEFSRRFKAIDRSSIDCVLGVNIGKTKLAPLDQALEDYLQCFEQVRELADYFTINVSSPNTPELRKLQEPERLTRLIGGLQAANTSRRPLFVKIAPDLTRAELDALLETCLDQKISGIIATNTTFSRESLNTQIDQQGGLSGAPLQEKACAVVKYIFDRTEGKLPIIGVGGISSAEDAIRFLHAGASLLQVYTGLIYEGPAIVRNICAGILKYMQDRQMKSLSDFHLIN